MKLIRTSLLNGLAVGIKLLTYAGLNKVLAVYVGPGGYAIIGQFQSAVMMGTTFAGGAINPGVTKFTAEYFDDAERQRAVWRTAGTMSIGMALLLSVPVALFHRSLSTLLLHDARFSGVFLWFAVAFVLFVLNGLLLAILNGKKEIGRYVAINIAGSVAGLIVTAGLAVRWGLYGALVALVVNQSAVFGVTFALCLRTSWFRPRDLWGTIDPDVARRLGKFAIMALTTGIVMPLSQFFVRNHLVAAFGWRATGNWQAVTRISDLYLMLVTMTLSVYFIPRLSEIRSREEMRREIFEGYRFILPLTALGAGTIFVLRDFIIKTMFTPEFAPMRDLFGWQLVGDIVKIGSWILGSLMLGRAMTTAYVVTEVIFGFGIVVFVMLLTPVMGVRGATAAFTLTYALHWLAMFWITRREIHSMESTVIAHA